MKLFKLLLLLFLVANAFGQCPPEDELSFSNQTEVDNFLINYPNCTSFSGDISIENSWANITNLNGFQNLEVIEGYLYILNNLGITNLSGLENLHSIGGRLWIKENPNLITLNGLENLNWIGEGLSLNVNDNLENINSLMNLNSLDGHLRIDYNPNLLNLIGLENITTLNDHLYIGYNDLLSSLSGLENLNSIGDYLHLSNNFNLENLDSLSNLTSIGGGLSLSANEIIQNLNGLGNVNSIGGRISLTKNDSLKNLNGLENITTISEQVWIFNNNNLETLSGLDNLTSIGAYLGIRGNDILKNLSGLENLVSIEEYLEIKENDDLQSLIGLESLIYTGSEESEISENNQLSYCAIFPICSNLIAGTGEIDIDNNTSGCNNPNQVIAQCDALGTITTSFFFDLNENTLQDLGEPLVPVASATIDPGGYVVYSNAANGGRKFLDYGTYSITHNDIELPNWELTDNISTYYSTLDPTNNRDTVSFGLRPTDNLSFIYTGCANGLPRCNEFVTFEVFAINEGTTIVDGTLWFELDSAILGTTFIDPPDTLDGDYRVGWFYTDLYPGGNNFKRKMSIQLPGPPSFPIGDFLYFNIRTNFEDVNGFHNNILNVHRVELLCSYDPNDKLVAPQYYNDYALIDEDLTYTIRFQNTGNAEAYDVVIEDLLSEDLDLFTFKYLSSSHESVLSTHINDHLLTFEFRDIFLPDSTTNFDESQGYVMYSIRVKDTISENTVINNTANIFFDFNPAIVTNTTENTMWSTFDLDEDGFEFWIDCDDNNALVNPGVLEMPYNGLDDDCNEVTFDDDLDQDGYLLSEDCNDEDAAINIDAEEIPYNGIDDDCNEVTFDDDLDQDGYPLSEDCDDEDPAINIGAVEIPNNNIDEDCDGEDGIVAAEEILHLLPKVFPNPTTSGLQIMFPASIEGSYSFRNLSGIELLKGDLKKEIELDLTNYAKGVYLLLLLTDENVSTVRVLKL